MTDPRVIAVGLVIRTDGALLVTRGEDRASGHQWHRLIGGGVEHGELGAAAVAREFAEEYGLEVAVGEHLAAVENLFTLEGVQGHELVLVYRTRLLDVSLETQPMLPSVEPGQPPCMWVSADEARLVPEELRALVSSH